MRAITIDDEIVDYEAPICGVFKEMYRQEVFEDEEVPTIIILHPLTYQEVSDNSYLDPMTVYLIVVVSETLIHEAVQKTMFDWRNSCCRTVIVM